MTNYSIYMISINIFRASERACMFNLDTLSSSLLKSKRHQKSLQKPSLPAEDCTTITTTIMQNSDVGEWNEVGIRSWTTR